VFSSIKATSSRRRIPTSIGISLTLTLCLSLTLSLFNLSVAWKCTPCPVVPFVFLYLVTVKNMDDDQILNCWKFTYTNQLHCMYIRYHNLSTVVNLLPFHVKFFTLQCSKIVYGLPSNIQVNVFLFDFKTSLWN
jgi:hypothetical protein